PLCSSSPSFAPLALPSSLHDALPIFHNPPLPRFKRQRNGTRLGKEAGPRFAVGQRDSLHIDGIDAPLTIDAVFIPMALPFGITRDRKSTRLNSSHLVISYAVFCLKKK